MASYMLALLISAVLVVPKAAHARLQGRVEPARDAAVHARLQGRLEPAHGAGVSEEYDGSNSVEEPFRRPCTCLPWTQAYYRKNVSCGQGLEPFTSDIYCKHFFEKIRDNWCVQAHPETKTEDQWCYVSDKCDKLNLGNKVPNSKASWKYCSKHDDLLRDKPPRELARIAGEQDIEKGMLAKMAYPVHHMVKWPHVEDIYKFPYSSKRPTIPNQTMWKVTKRYILEELKNSGKPWILDSQDGHPPYVMVWGQSLYLVAANKGHMDIMQKIRGMDIWVHPSEITAYQCIDGCDDGNEGKLF